MGGWADGPVIDRWMCRLVKDQLAVREECVSGDREQHSLSAWTLTQTPELHSRAAQLDGFSDQTDLRRVHVRGTHVKVIQQVLNAPRDAPAGDPTHVPCGEQGVDHSES